METIEGLAKIALVLFNAYQIHQLIWVVPFRPIFQPGRGKLTCSVRMATTPKDGDPCPSYGSVDTWSSQHWEVPDLVCRACNYGT